MTAAEVLPSVGKIIKHLPNQLVSRIFFFWYQRNNLIFYGVPMEPRENPDTLRQLHMYKRYTYFFFIKRVNSHVTVDIFVCQNVRKILPVIPRQLLYSIIICKAYVQLPGLSCPGKTAFCGYVLLTYITIQSSDYQVRIQASCQM